jgi:hypothetical protein
LFSKILEGEIELVADLVAHHTADTDPTRLGHRFEPRGNVDAVAEDVVAVDDDVAEIDADAEVDTALRRLGMVGHRRLPLGRTLDGVDDTGELDEQAVAGGLHDTPMVLCYLWVG